MDADRWNNPAPYNNDVRVAQIFDLYVHLLKYGCEVTEVAKMDESYLIGVAGKADSSTARWFVLSPAGDKNE